MSDDLVERFGLEAINHHLMVNVCRLTARVAALEVALDRILAAESPEDMHYEARKARGDGEG